MAASNASPFEINDFSEGITDDVFSNNIKKSAGLDNFLIGTDRGPYSRFGSELDDVTNAQIPTGDRLGSLINYAHNDNLFYISLRAIYYRNPSAFTELVGPTGNPAFTEGDVTSVQSFTQWNRHLYLTNDAYALPMKVYKDGSNTYQLRNSGLPDLANTPTVTAGAVGDQSFLYTFHYAYDYTVFNLDYESIGPTVFTRLEDSGDPSINSNIISNIPVLVNGTLNNYDTANIKVFIYRTTDGGTFSQKVGEVTNGTTSFVDNVSDVTLQNTGISLYTNDGTADYDPPPLHKFVHVASNTAIYGGIKDADGESPYKFRQSIPGVPDTAPIDFEGEVDDEMTGVSSVRNFHIILCKKYIFRVDGFFDQFGRGGAVPIRIHDTAGCISNNSCVQAENGLFWLGNEGVWFTDGYMAKKISDFNSRYKTFLENTNQKNRIVGKFFEKERLIMWAIQTNSANLDNDSLLVLDLKFGVRDDSTFTTWSGRSFRPSALEIFNDELFRGDQRGFTFRHAENLTTDKKVDIFRPASDWVSETIIWTIETIHYNFGSTFFRKMPTRILLSCADAGNTTIQITAINDDGKFTRNLKPIRNRRDFIWRDDDFVWRVSDFIWRGAGIIEQWRRFPARGLRLSYLQLIITNGYSDIANSDSLGTATFAGVANTATLNVVTNKWPLDSEDYFIATESDSYVTEYLISRRTSDSVITINDPLNTFPTGSLKWVIRGYKKAEPLDLIGFNIHWANVSATQETYDSSAAATGENA